MNMPSLRLAALVLLGVGLLVMLFSAVQPCRHRTTRLLVNKNIVQRL